MKRSRIVFAAILAGILAGCGEAGIPPAGSTATVQGTISDRATNQPVGGATVTIDSVLTTSTTADGTYKFTNVPPGAFDYVVTASGYTQARGNGDAETTAPATLDVQLDKPNG